MFTTPIFTLFSQKYYLNYLLSVQLREIFKILKAMALISSQSMCSRRFSLGYPSFSPFQSQYPSSIAASNSFTLSVRSTIHSPKLTGSVNGRPLGVPRAAVSEFNPIIGDILGDVSIFTASGQLVKFKDLWDQNEVRMLL